MDKPDTVIINGGTNNFTKTFQSVEEIAEEILEIVETCRNAGVKNILVSSITCRPKFQCKVDGVNRLLQENAVYHKYDFIDNECIREIHLKGDRLHLNKEGVAILASNFLAHLNRPCLSIPIRSLWEL